MADQPNTPLFGTPPAVSPAALQLRRQMALELMKQGSEATPIRSPWQGVGRIVQSAVGGYGGYQADQAEKAARTESAAKLAAALKEGNMGGAIGAMSDPFANPEAGKLLATVLTPQMVDQGLGTQARDRFGNPVGPFIPKTQVFGAEAGPGTKFPMPLRGTPQGTIQSVPVDESGGPQAPGQPSPGAQPPPPQGGGVPQVAKPPAQQGGMFTPAGERPVGFQVTQNGQDVGGGNFPTTRAGMAAWSNKNNAEREGMKTMAEKAAAARMVPLEEVMKETRTAPQALNAINTIEDVAKQEMAKGTTTGMAGEPMLKLRQTINGLAGREVLGETAGPETMKKMNAYLASAATQAMTARGTQFDFKVNMQNQPGNLENSWKGTLYLSNIMKQIHRQNLELGQILQQPGNAYNSTDIIKQYYDSHPLIDPVTGNKLGVSSNTGEQRGGPRIRRFNTKTGDFEEVTQ